MNQPVAVHGFFILTAQAQDWRLFPVSHFRFMVMVDPGSLYGHLTAKDVSFRNMTNQHPTNLRMNWLHFQKAHINKSYNFIGT